MNLYTRQPGPDASLYAKFVVRGRQYQWCTRTSDRTEAKTRAEEYRQRIIAGQMGLVDQMKATKGFPTITELIAYYKKHSLNNTERSRESCAWSLLRVCKCAGIAEHRTVDALSSTTWETFMRRRTAGLEGEVLASAKRTVNSDLRRALAVFSKAMMRSYKKAFTMPDLRGFLEMDRFRAPHPRFQSVPQEVTTKALEAARAAGGPYYNAATLALFAGLRFCEARVATWDWLTKQPDGNYLIRIPALYAKSKESRTVPLAGAVVDNLMRYRESGNPLIVASTIKGDQLFQFHLSKALRKAGIDARKPLHELRKQFGAMVATTHGIYVAQRLLGHSSPTLTSAIYADLVSMPPPISALAFLPPPNDPQASQDRLQYEGGAGVSPAAGSSIGNYGPATSTVGTHSGVCVVCSN